VIIDPSRQRQKSNERLKDTFDRRRCQGNKAVNTSFGTETRVKNLRRKAMQLINQLII
jgi:hypothetical protein